MRRLKAACLKIIITHSNAFIFMSFSPERIWALIKFYAFYSVFLRVFAQLKNISPKTAAGKNNLKQKRSSRNKCLSLNFKAFRSPRILELYNMYHRLPQGGNQSGHRFLGGGDPDVVHRTAMLDRQLRVVKVPLTFCAFIDFYSTFCQISNNRSSFPVNLCLNLLRLHVGAFGGGILSDERSSLFFE